MENPQSYIADVDDSAEFFAAQFDPDDPNYHGGDPTLVPMGGNRVPDSMPTEYDPSAHFNDTPMDPEYYRLSEIRNFLLEFKKVMSQVPPCIEAKMRAQRFKDPEKKEKAMSERHNALMQTLETVWNMKSSLDVYMPGLSEESAGIVQAANREFTTKTEYGEYMFWVSNFCQKIFKESQNILQQMKTIKNS